MSKMHIYLTSLITVLLWTILACQCNHLHEMNQKLLNSPHRDLVKRNSMASSKNHSVEILDEKYDTADLPKLVAEICTHLTISQQVKLLVMLKSCKVLFNGTLSNWQTELIILKLKRVSQQYHHRQLRILYVHLDTHTYEVERLENIGLKRQPPLEWAFYICIFPKQTKTAHFIYDLREVNKQLIQTPFLIPK